MSSPFAAYKKFAIVFAVLSALILYIIYSLLKVTPTLPVIQPTMVASELVDTTMQDVKKYHRIADWQLINQNNDTITQDYYKDKIYVADFFFTTCQTICPIMTGNMAQLQKELRGDDDVLLLSHSVTPEYDTPAILKDYARKKGVNASKWNLVTGPKKDIYELARKSYLAVKDEGSGGKYDMIHTENFMLVDKKRQVRGSYDGTDPEDIDRLLEDIEYLKEEYRPKKTFMQRLFGR